MHERSGHGESVNNKLRQKILDYKRTDRIMAAVEAAGVKQIDHLILTHYHGDHVGGVEELAKRISIAHFIDHGPNSEPKEQVPGFQKLYEEMLTKAKHTVAKPGDKIPFDSVTVAVVTSNGQVLKRPLPEAANLILLAPALRRGMSRAWTPITRCR